MAEGLAAGHERLPGADRVPVARQGVDLPVVCDAPEGVRSIPAREAVRGEPRVHLKATKKSHLLV